MTDSAIAVTRQGRALLKFPDRQTSWAVVLAASLERPILAEQLDNRLESINGSLPLVGSRLRDQEWIAGRPPKAFPVAGPVLEWPGLVDFFELNREPPFRLAIQTDGTRLAIAGHHAAFDGLGLVSVMSALLGGPIPVPASEAPPGPGVGPWPVLRRLLHPADPVAPSIERVRSEALVSRAVRIEGPNVTARLAAACAAAAGERNAAVGARWRRIGMSLGVGGPRGGVGNTATYRRIDVRASSDVAAAVRTALADPREPSEQRRRSRVLPALHPIVGRLSDSLLVSNVGRHDLPMAVSLELFPVARGRSAVAFGCAGLATGIATISLRARDMNVPDAENLLSEVVRRMTEN